MRSPALRVTDGRIQIQLQRKLLLPAGSSDHLTSFLISLSKHPFHTTITFIGYQWNEVRQCIRGKEADNRPEVGMGVSEGDS